jgi:hypothetical protein
MKKGLAINLILILLLAAGCTGRSGRSKESSNTQPGDTGKAILTFAEIEHDFGRIKEGEKVGCIFSFTNTGTSDLLINYATTSCGCTVPKYDRKPIAPGSKGSIEVVFDAAGRNGIQTKTITVQSNAASPVMLLQIKAEVIPGDK